MALSREIKDLEKDKFEEVNGKPVIRTMNSSNIEIPPNTDYISASYPDGLTEIYVYKNGGVNGVVLKTVTYTATSKTEVSSVSWI